MLGRAPLVLCLAALVALLVPVGAAEPTTRSCELIPHGHLVGAAVLGCSVRGEPKQRIEAIVSVTGGTVDAIEIEMLSSEGQRHIFVCGYAAITARCLFPVQKGDIAGNWTVSARIVAADPLGPFFFGGADTYARLDATFT